MHGSSRYFAYALAFLVLSMIGQQAQAQYPSPRPPFSYVYPKAPDMTGPGFYTTAPCGTTYGPNYSIVPCHMPFQGMVMGPACPGRNCSPGARPNPFIRSPRDFFMLD